MIKVTDYKAYDGTSFRTEQERVHYECSKFHAQDYA